MLSAALTQLALPFPNIDPVLLQLGPVAIRWYSLAYIGGIVLGWIYARRMVRDDRLWNGKAPVTVAEIDDFILWATIGIILGGRLGFVLFYDLPLYLDNPLAIFQTWKGGMSFHGGLLGVIVALALFARKLDRPFLQVADLVAPCVPTGLASGRIGNFINGELWGRAADPSLPWAMVFPQANDGIARHPSQLYQFALEGLLLFALLWWYGAKPRATGQVSGAFLMGYGVFRFIAEWFREPDSFLGLLALGMSMGQWLCLPMIAAGAALWWWSGRRGSVPATQ